MPPYLSDAQERLKVRNVVFLLGAGASYDHGYPLVREFLSRKYLTWLCDQCAGLPAGVGDSSKMLAHALAEADAFRKTSDNFEEVLSVAFESPSFYQRVLDYTSWLLGTAWDVVHSSDLMTTAEYYGLAILMFELSQVGPCSVITFNYDTAVEDATSSLGRLQARRGTPRELLYFNYGFTRPVLNVLPPRILNFSASTLPDAYPNGRVPVLKLHGSVSTLVCRACDAVHYVPMEMLSQQWAKLIPRTCKACDEGSLQVLMVPPGKRKKIPAPLEELWIAAHAQLASSELVVIAGYSMPEYDVEARELLRATLTGKDVLLVDPSPNDSAVAFLNEQAKANLRIVTQTTAGFLRSEMNVFVPGLLENVSDACALRYLNRDQMHGYSRS